MPKGESVDKSEVRKKGSFQASLLLLYCCWLAKGEKIIGFARSLLTQVLTNRNAKAVLVRKGYKVFYLASVEATWFVAIIARA